MNVHLPEELGGPGLSIFDGILSARSSPGAAPGSPSRSSPTRSAPRRSCSRAATSRSASGSPPLIEEPLLCSFALTEPNAGSDVSGIQTTAVRQATSTSSTARRCSSRTPATRPGWSSSPRPTRARASAGLSAFVVPADADGVHGREAPRQDGPARDRHLGARLPGREGAGGEPARRGGRRLQDRDAHARPHAPGHGDRRRRASRARRTSSPSTTRASASSSASRSR